MKPVAWYFLAFLALSSTIPSFSRAAEPTVRDSHEAMLDRGWQAFRQGAFEEAGQTWAKAARVYAERQDGPRQTEALTYLAYAYEALGQYRKALQQLELAQAVTLQIGGPERVAVILGRVANNYLALGQMEAAEKALVEAIERARGLDEKTVLAALLNDYGNVLVAQQRTADALGAYRESAYLAKELDDPTLATTALVNLVRAMADPDQTDMRKLLLDEALGYAIRMTPSHEKAYSLVSVGLAYHEVGRREGGNGAGDLARSVLVDAVALAQSLSDARAESYGWGYLGSLSEHDGRDQEGLELTRKALVAAQRIQAPESLYRWYWQMGRLLKRIGDVDGALAAYRKAVSVLQSIRGEMAAGYSTGRTSFRESVGPVYFELADLLLQRSAADDDRQQALLSEARDSIELLKAGELRDYFRDDCVDAAQARVTRLDVVSPTAAAVYPVLLPDRMEILVSLPNGIKRVRVPISADAVTKEIRVFRYLLEKRTTREYLPHAQQLYDWIIRPLEQLVLPSQIDTLVFVPDGALRTIPMAALHDGEQFLIAKYAVATSPGLNLTDPHPFTRRGIKVLSAGLTESVQGFPPLPNVSTELDALQKLYHGESMLNKEFKIARFARMLADKGLTLVHIASHGEFKNAAAESFLLTYDDKLTMDRLNEYIGLLRFREEPLELLTLSACETAAGDDRAALGLAGIAIKAGARSALATLWSINDEASSDLIAEFYHGLQEPAVSKALALQRAQLKLMKDPRYQHPGYWSPFLLLNNWL